MVTKAKNTGGDVAQQGKDLAKEAAYSPYAELITRIGYAARGIIYALVGILALMVALGGRGKLTTQQGAIETIGAQPFGFALLILIAIGLVGYAIWGLVRAFLDPFHKGKDLKGLITRAGYVVSAVSYGALVYPTLQYIRGSKVISSGSQNQQQLAASVMTKPWGPWVIGAIGVIAVIGGLYQVYLGWKAKFDLHFDSYKLKREQRDFAYQLGRFGTAARGVVFAIVGGFLVQAAMTHNASQAKGIDGALQALARQPYGVWLLGIVALGLIAFGMFSIMGAFWFRFNQTRRSK